MRAVPTAAIVQPLGAKVQGPGIADELRERGRRTELRRPVPARAIAASARVAA